MIGAWADTPTGALFQLPVDLGDYITFALGDGWILYPVCDGESGLPGYDVALVWSESRQQYRARARKLTRSELRRMATA